MDDHALVLKAQQGDADAFGELYEHHAPGVFRFVYAHLEHRQDAEDITEEVFFRAWRALPRYRERGVPFQFYLLRIARNVLIDHFRRGKLPDLNRLRSVDLMENDLSDANAGKREMEGEHAELAKHLRSLPEAQRIVLVLRYFNRLSPDETAEVMGRSAGAIRVLQHRALIKLKALIQAERERDQGPGKTIQ
ncbi:MAG: RNA polymerase sigma factor [Anaerolineales bacterium]|nr:RNA polymerase sigma factor [Anaerolineales bacterium]